MYKCGNYMKEVTIKDVDIYSILRFFLMNYSNLSKEKWRCGNQLHAIFVHINNYVSCSYSPQTFVIYVEYDLERNIGRIKIQSSGRRQGRIMRWKCGTADSAEEIIYKKLVKAVHRLHGEITLTN